MTFTKFIGVFATYSDLFGKKYDVTKLQKLIGDLPFDPLINILSQFSSNQNGIDNKFIKTNFIEFLRAAGISHLDLIEEKLSQQVIYSKQGILSVWKWILAHGDQTKTVDEIQVWHAASLIIYLNLITSDYLNDERMDINEIKYDLFTNVFFNSEQPVNVALARAVILFNDIAQEEDGFNKKEYIDVHEAFINKYGYSIKDYLASVFLIFAGFIKKDSELVANWIRPSNYFGNTNIPELSQKILEELSISVDEAREWSLSTLNEPWNYTLFRQRPILTLTDGSFMPISLVFLFETVFSELYFKIRHSFPSENTQVISFFGRCFERYIETIATQAVNLSTLPYEYIKEFHFGKRRSPDAMIRLGNKLLVIEAKVRRLSMDSLINPTKESIDKDINRMVITPLKQLHNCLMELKNIDHPVLKGVDEIHLMSVTYGAFPSLPPFEEEINNSLIEHFEIPVRGHYHLDIEEFELLAELMSRRNAAPVFKYLDNKTRLMKNMSFKNFLFSSNLRPRIFGPIKHKLDIILNEISDIAIGPRDEKNQ
ncbi:hypothetical protein [Paenibacillus sp. 2TAB19]|uniref:hypothetical protein n=1 Tax=Paenibacillus sp. 2TAB19 TaxID=3233003 RepID=UPI003F97CD44